MQPLLFAMPGNEAFADALAARLNAEIGRLTLRHFPDGESYVRAESECRGRSVAIVCTLSHPDSLFLPLVFLADLARELGAARVGLIAPYLAYMRQDRVFKPGEAVTSNSFARLISESVDWLVTVDPHLHRHHKLSEIYSIPASALHAAPLISNWISANVERPLLVGPDIESEQWVAAVAQDAGAPHVILEKTRRGDREVEISVPQVERWRDHTPVLVDDIISTARTMIETAGHLRRAGLVAPICIGIHGIFANSAYEDLQSAGAARIVTCNTIAHESNAIEVEELAAEAAMLYLSGK